MYFEPDYYFTSIKRDLHQLAWSQLVQVTF